MYCHPLLCTVIIGGYLNADIVNSLNTTSLLNFVSDEDLMLCMKSDNCINIDYNPQ